MISAKVAIENKVSIEIEKLYDFFFLLFVFLNCRFCSLQFLMAIYIVLKYIKED